MGKNNSVIVLFFPIVSLWHKDKSDPMKLSERQLLGGSSAEAGTWKKTAFLEIVSIKL